MLKRLIHLLSILTIFGLVFAFMAMPSAPSGVASAQSEEIPLPLPPGCQGVAPLDDPDACCAFGYVYYNDAPIAGATVRIESADATWEDTTGDYGVSDDAHYQVDLTTDLNVAPGDEITITVSYNNMVSTRTWTVQPGSQQVDVGLIDHIQYLTGGSLKEQDGMLFIDREESEPWMLATTAFVGQQEQPVSAHWELAELASGEYRQTLVLDDESLEKVYIQPTYFETAKRNFP